MTATVSHSSDAYALGIMGDFLAPEVCSGDIAVFDPHAGLAQGGEVVAVWHKGKSQPSVVRLFTAVPPPELANGDNFAPALFAMTSKGKTRVNMEKVERIDRMVRKYIQSDRNAEVEA